MNQKNRIGHVQLISSALKPEEYPNWLTSAGKRVPEIVLVGRSNVGKSSLINHLCDQPSLAKTSTTPGKTERLHFFLVDRRWFLVDLPGYGFAAKAKAVQKEWSAHIEHYLNTRHGLTALLLLIDSRQLLQPQDDTILKWADHRTLPVIVVFTKADKLSKQAQRNFFQVDKGSLNRYPSLLYSTRSGKCRERLLSILRKIWG